MKSEKYRYLTEEGLEVEGTFWFNFTPVEISEWMAEYPGGDLGGYLQKLGSQQNYKEMFVTLREIVSRSIGERRPNGSFVKTKDYTDEFMSGDKYSSLFLEFYQDAGRMAGWVNSIMPANLADRFTHKKKTYDREELLAMTDAAFLAAVSDNGRLKEHEWSRDNLLVAMQRKNQARAA